MKSLTEQRLEHAIQAAFAEALAEGEPATERDLAVWILEYAAWYSATRLTPHERYCAMRDGTPRGAP